MARETILRELLEKKRAYESLLAINSSGKHKSFVVETMLQEHLQGVLSSIENLQKTAATRNRSANEV